MYKVWKLVEFPYKLANMTAGFKVSEYREEIMERLPIGCPGWTKAARICTAYLTLIVKPVVAATEHYAFREIHYGQIKSKTH